MHHPGSRQRVVGRHGLLVCDLLFCASLGRCRQPIWLAQQEDQAAVLACDACCRETAPSAQAVAALRFGQWPDSNAVLHPAVPRQHLSMVVLSCPGHPTYPSIILEQ